MVIHFEGALNFWYIITARKRSLGQGNIFTPVCHSVHGGGGIPACIAGGTHPTGMHSCFVLNFLYSSEINFRAVSSVYILCVKMVTIFIQKTILCLMYKVFWLKKER